MPARVGGRPETRTGPLGGQFDYSAPMHEVIRHRFLRWAGRTVTTHPRMVLGICLITAALAVLLTVQRLTFLSDRSALVSTELEWNRRYLQFKDDFPRWGDVIVCIEGAAGDRRIDEVARAAADAFRACPRSRTPTRGSSPPRPARGSSERPIPPSSRRVSPSSRRLAASPRPRTRTRRWPWLRPGCNAPTSRRPTMAATRSPGSKRSSPTSPGPSARLPRFDWLDPAASPEARRWQPLASDSGRIRFVLVELAVREGDGIDAISRGLAALLRDARRDRDRGRA